MRETDTGDRTQGDRPSPCVEPAASPGNRAADKLLAGNEAAFRCINTMKDRYILHGFQVKNGNGGLIT